jgi:hypothetical protein
MTPDVIYQQPDFSTSPPAAIEHEPIRWDQLGQPPEPGEEKIPLEPWLDERIAAHSGLVRQRPVRGDAWFELIAFVPVAGQMLRGNVTQAEVDQWSGSLGVGIRARGPEGEEDMFLVEGHNLEPSDELRAKVARLQNHILPKVKAGEWTP